jgi:hypothetical protein
LAIDAGTYFNGITTVLGVIIALYLSSYGTKLEKLNTELNSKVNKDSFDSLTKKVDGKAEKSDFDSFKDCVYDDCEKKSDSCSRSMCVKIMQIKEDLEKKIDKIENGFDKDVNDIWHHCNSHSHTNLPEGSKVIKIV